MDIFLRGFSPSSMEKELDEFLKPILGEFSIFTYHCQKLKGKGCAILTVTNKTQAEAFLKQHGLLKDPKPGQQAKKPLIFQRRKLVCCPSKNMPKELDLRALEMEEKARIQKLRNPVNQSFKGLKKIFKTRETTCGQWRYLNGQLTFSPQYPDDRYGQLLFGKSVAAIVLEPSGIHTSDCRIDIPYHSIETVVLGKYDTPSVTFTLSNPPKFYRKRVDVEHLLALLGLKDIETNGKTKSERLRVAGMSSIHAPVVGSCFVYQVILSEQSDIYAVRELFKRYPGMPSHVLMATPTMAPQIPFKQELDTLLKTLADASVVGRLGFGVKFQLQRLAVNGFLPPRTVLEMLPDIQTLTDSRGVIVISECIRRLSNQIDFAGPDVESRKFDAADLLQSLREVIKSYHDEGSIHDLSKKHAHLALVHRVNITPTGIYLEGPEPEVSNRVLRQYKDFSDHFTRVTFMDEDGGRLNYDFRASNTKIYHERFKNILQNGFNIAGYQYQFLGFSHSSLRNQTCWFSSPFVSDSTMFHAQEIITQLGNFDEIRSPAKCAARIGQAFSDTTGQVRIGSEMLFAMDDVTRDGRTFSDGCGTISLELMEKIWEVWPFAKQMKPTTLQIRFQGAKGVISLDKTLNGEKIYLRPSMVKFPGSPSWDIEMCGANFKSLPMYLNRQFIKILEDLEIPGDVFIELQREKVSQLRMFTENSRNASKLLELNKIGVAPQLSSLIRLMGDVGIQFQEDEFLSFVVEIAALTQLRELKYRSRILLDKGITLFGIMDETGFLKEGEVYCVTEGPEGGKSVISGGRLLITRAPALHPGDMQLVKAVDVPTDSPLSALRNCVVFSQHGSRDLPSQLSGGDLDGDLYNVIWDERLIPKSTHVPADYPRVPAVDLGRNITRNDMSGFFITFMETDQLGRISTMHLQMADRYEKGTMDPQCIKLAELASTAVDFSKTGIPVDMDQIPRQDSIKPDFLSPGPRVLIEAHGTVFEGEVDDEEDVVDALDPGVKKQRYYESKKILGQLFRDIDEQKFLKDIHKQAYKKGGDRNSEQKAMNRLWAYVKKEAALVQWENYRPLARQIRETYEYNLANSLHDSSPNPSQPVSEVEVFSGSILGKAATHRGRNLREHAADMKEQFDRHVVHTIEAITTDDAGSKSEALARAMACLAIGVEEEGKHVRKVGHLKSWKYIAAGVCLIELERFLGPALLRRFPNFAYRTSG